MGRFRSPLAASLAEYAGAAWHLWSFLRDPAGDGPADRPPRRPGAGRPAAVAAAVVAVGAMLAALALA